MSVSVERSDSVDNNCSVCHDPYEIFAIGPCDHPVCYRCSTRMRALCKQMDCPICRSQMSQVAFVCKNLLFKDINLRSCIPNRKYKIFFEDEDVEAKYLQLLEFCCKICRNRGPEVSFAQLQTHMRRDHQLFSCELCLMHIKIFPFERKFYTRKNLAIHRRLGDDDDKSYKGHPLCEFCDVRYNDKDELLRHLRKDHYFCHFCDQHGSNAYYDQYPDLMNHFQELHFLCTEGECANVETRFTHAFASEIDFKAHKAKMHSKNLSKAQSREARAIELDFHLAPRRVGNNRGAGITADDFDNVRSSQSGQGRGERYIRRRKYDQEDADMKRAIEASMELVESKPAVVERVPDPVNDFPTLNGAVPVSAPAVIGVYSKPINNTEDFPTLASSTTAKVSMLHTQPPTKAYSSVMNAQVLTQVAAPSKKESKPVSLGSIAKVSQKRYSVQAPKNSEEEYPALRNNLSSSNHVASNANATSWIKKSQPNSNVSLIQPTSTIQHYNHHRPKTLETLSRTLRDEEEFPSLANEGGLLNRNTGVFAKPFTDSSKNLKINTKKTAAKTDKFDDANFELPDSYYKAFKENSSSKPVNDNDKASDSSNELLKPVPALTASLDNAKEFPGLPVHHETPAESASEKKRKQQKKNKKTEEKVNSKTKPKNDSNASLSEIAQALVQPEINNVRDISGKTETEGAKNKKTTDWFDNPPTDYSEATQTAVMKSEEKASFNKKEDSPLPLEKEKPKPVNLAEGDSFPSLSISAKRKENLSLIIGKEMPEQIDLADSGSFPSFHTISNSVEQPKPPPGFTLEHRSLEASPVTPVSAPPGFKKQFLLPSTPSPPPGFPVNAAYIQPPEFSERNLKLIEDIREALAPIQDGFYNFKVLSGQYRQGMLGPSNYYSSCETLMGEKAFAEVLPELLALLPDISKQTELWDVYQATIIKKKKLSEAYPASMSEHKMKQCHSCGQVILKQDLQHHQMHHSSFTDFPSLGELSKTATSGGSKGGPEFSVKGAWIKAK